MRYICCGTAGPDVIEYTLHRRKAYQKSLDKETKSEIISQYRVSEGDTGSVEVQVALLTNRIVELTSHLRTHRKDIHTRVGLLKLVGQRRNLLKYLTREDVARYRILINRLGLRR